MIKRIALVLTIFAAVALTVPASPIHVSYVYSDSMEPTLDVNDGYVVVDAPVEVGDVAVYRSEDRDEYVTHRIVDRTDEGFVTKGDNNQATDQATGHPYVQRDDVVGRVLTLGGKPLTIPKLGVFLAALGENRLPAAAVGALLVVASLLSDSGDGGDRPERSVLRLSDVTHPLLVVGLLAAVGVLLTTAVTHDITYVAIEGGGPGADTLAVGEPATEEVLLSLPQQSFIYRMVDTQGMQIAEHERNESAIAATLRVPPQKTPGPHEASLTVYRYPAVLPRDIVRTLHSTSPVLAVSTTVGTLFAPVFLAYAVLFDGKKPLRLGRTTRRLAPWRSR